MIRLAIFGLHPLTPWKLTYALKNCGWEHENSDFSGDIRSVSGGKNPFKNPGGLGFQLSRSRLLYLQDRQQWWASWILPGIFSRGSSGRGSFVWLLISILSQKIHPSKKTSGLFLEGVRGLTWFEKFGERILKVMGPYYSRLKIGARQRTIKTLQRQTANCFFVQETSFRKRPPVTRAESPPVS